MWRNKSREHCLIGPGYASWATDKFNMSLTFNGILTLKDAENNEMVRIGIDEHGGYVQTNGRSKGHAIMGINEKGNGTVSTYDKNGYRQ